MGTEQEEKEIILITFESGLNKHDDILAPHESLLNEIEKYFTVRYVYYRNVGALESDSFKVVFIASGGVERLVTQYFEQLPHPLLLLTDGLQNSFPAALEIASWARSRGVKTQIVHADPVDAVKQLFLCYTNFRAYKKLRGKRIGVIGAPSSWLIASSVDYLLAKRRWGVEYIDLHLERVFHEFKKISDDDIGEAASVFAKNALACREGTPDDLLKAMRLYRAVKNIVEKDKLDAITLNCFGVIEAIGVTGCLALSLLNDEGILAGCEGDLQAIFTMSVVEAVTGQSGFMANPSHVDEKKNEILLAHCTIATNMTEKYIIRNHFETRSGIAIQGICPQGGDVTVVKCGGECLDEYFVSSGRLVENTNLVSACRTQLKVKLNSSAGYFLRNPLGNHHIMVHGNHEVALNEFFRLNGCKRME